MKQKAFTLIELLVVVAIIGLLATLVVANFNAARSRGRDARRKSDVRNIQTALRLYYNDFGIYPTSSGALEIEGCGATGVSACAWASSPATEWSTSNDVYMSILPNDPLPGLDYRYTQIDADTYTFEACLENESDEKCAGNAGWCPAGSGCIYTVAP